MNPRRVSLGGIAAAAAFALLLTTTTETPAHEPAKKTAAVPAFSPMPDGIASFGAAVDGDWLYVYGGHTGKTHTYSKTQSSSRFQRINLKQGGSWEELPTGPGLQGLVLLSHQSRLYRVGGMAARNETGQPDDLHSLRDVARFDPQTKSWTSLPSLPEGRSSHGAVVVENKLYVFGGWNLQGTTKEAVWQTSILALDLGTEKGEWKEVGKAPFARRAMAATAVEGKVYVTGGLLAKGGISKDMDVFDVKAGNWSKGPEIPGIPMNGNGLAVCGTEKSLYLSGMDGKVYRLNKAKDGWDLVGRVEQPRIHHKLLSAGHGVLLAVGGATMSGNLKTTDSVRFEAKH